MNKKQICDTMQQAEQEILSLRRLVERLEPDAHSWKVLCRVLGHIPEQGQGAGIDVAWLLRREIAELTPKTDSATAANVE